MSGAFEYRRIAAAFRRVLKARGITYEAVATKLGTSSRTVKRIVNGDDYSIAKLADACEAVGIKFFDLMHLANEEEYESFQLTLDQEEFLATNLKHFKVFRDLVQGKSMVEVKDLYGLSSKAANEYAKDLESIGLLERHPGNQVKLLVKSRLHTFLTDGPLSRAVVLKDLQLFVERLHVRAKTHESFSISSGTRLSAKSVATFEHDAKELVARYQLVAQREQSMLPDDELKSVRWLIGLVSPFSTWVDALRP